MTNDLDPLIEALLEPVPGSPPCGASIRHDPLFTRVRLARQEDDPSLPMGPSARTVRQADWPLIERLCADALAVRSKDLQLAAWLCEAWMRQQGLPGLARGLVLVHELLSRYWDSVHPRIDVDGDDDARVAPLMWLNESLSVSIRRHLPLLRVPRRQRPFLTLVEWDLLQRPGDAATAPAAGSEAEPVLTGEQVMAAAGRIAPALRHAALGSASASLEAVLAMAALLDDRLGLQAPSLSRLASAIEDMLRMLRHCLGSAMAAASPPPHATAQDLPKTMDTDMQDPDTAQPDPGPVLDQGWTSREEAYRTLEALAHYLGQIEPHSPTPYLVRRAVRWGRMSLPELMAEILRDEGDLERMLKFLGLQRPGT